MAKQRWTVRGIERTTVESVQKIQVLTGLPHGAIVDCAIANGLDAAKRQLVEQISNAAAEDIRPDLVRDYFLNVDRVIDALIKVTRPK